MSSTLQAVTDRDFDKVVGGTAVSVLVGFWKPGCGHCHVLLRELEYVQREAGANLLILTMNVAENYQIPAELEVSSLPALALYQNGEFVKFIGGLGTKEELLKQVRS